MDIKSLIIPGIARLGAYLPRPVSLDTRLVKSKQNIGLLPRISIVVPSFNQGMFIDATLQSIIHQQYPNLELIVVDGGSTDNTLDVIKQYEDHLAWWVSEPDTGQTSAINKGFMRSSGDVMAWINSDDIIAPGALHKIAEYFIYNPKVHAVYGNRIIINEAGLEIGRWVLPPHSSRVLKWVDFVPQETLYWRREAWDLVGARLDETFCFAMDWDFILRLSANYMEIHHLSIFLGFFRVHKNQKTSDKISSVGREEMQMLRQRELGYKPSRWQVILNVLPYLLLARFCEILF